MAIDPLPVREFVRALARAFADNDPHTLAALFLPTGWFRDLLVSSWQFHSVPAPSLPDFFSRHPFPLLDGLDLDPSLPVTDGASAVDGGDTFLAVFLIFNLRDLGAGRGFLRLKPTAAGLKIYSLGLALYDLAAHPSPTGPNRPLGTSHNPAQRRTNWLEDRQREKEFANDEPTVLIVGAGQGGLMLAARLRMGGVPCLIVEKSGRIGDSWRKRYRSLVLHDPVYADHFPYLPYPAHWPVFTPKDKLANWFEFYAEVMELNVWTDCTVLPGTSYDSADSTWSVGVKRADGTERVLHPKHVVQATGHSGEPNIPRFTGAEVFEGTLVHSSAHKGGEDWKGKKAVIIGCCNSAHDIAQDLYENGAEVTMVQRSETLVISSRPVLEKLLEGTYDEHSPFYEDADLMQTSTPINLLDKFHSALAPQLHELDSALHEGLRKAGFKLDMSAGGLFMKYYRRGGGYYIDVGCSKLIADAKIRIKQGVEVSRFLPNGVLFADRSVLPADLVVLATGYDSMKTTCAKVFGPDVGAKTREVWGVDGEGEIKGIWRSSGHPGFWFMGGNFQLARSYSRYLALQIMATEDGRMPRVGAFD